MNLSITSNVLSPQRFAPENYVFNLFQRIQYLLALLGRLCFKGPTPYAKTIPTCSRRFLRQAFLTNHVAKFLFLLRVARTKTPRGK